MYSLRNYLISVIENETWSSRFIGHAACALNQRKIQTGTQWILAENFVKHCLKGAIDMQHDEYTKKVLINVLNDSPLLTILESDLIKDFPLGGLDMFPIKESLNGFTFEKGVSGK